MGKRRIKSGSSDNVSPRSKKLPKKPKTMDNTLKEVPKEKDDEDLLKLFESELSNQ